MPRILRARVALLALLAVLLIPLWTATAALRGLNHVLTCQDRVPAALTVLAEGDSEPVLGSAIQVGRNEEPLLCDALQVTFASRERSARRAELQIRVTNRARTPWRGTMSIRYDQTTIPIGIGEVAPGATRVETIDLHLERGQHDVQGSLLIGP